MTNVLELAALMLAPDEREAVLGDLAEAGEGALPGLMDVLGLVVRHQMLLWKSWRPWIAALGLTAPSSFALMGISVSIALALRHNFSDLIFAGTAPTARSGLLSLLCRALLLLVCSWTAGFVVASISRRTLWVSALFCCSPCLFCLARFRTESLSRLCLFLFLLPAIFGVRHGLRSLRIHRRTAIGIAIPVSLSMIYLSLASEVWILNWILLWPAWYLAASARRSNVTAG